MLKSLTIRNLSNLSTRTRSLTILHHIRSRGVQEGTSKSNAVLAVKALSSSSSSLNTSHKRFQSSLSEEGACVNNDYNNKCKLLSTEAKVRRTFSPNSNASAMLVCGGKELAAYASFDPEYKRAKGYIHNHAVGPAVLSPILISGLVGALVESTLPQSVFISGNMKQLRPLIVGVEVEASIKVVSVKNCNEETMRNTSNDEHSYVGGAFFDRYHGFELVLDTQVKRVSDGAIVSSGNQTVWLPDY